MKTKEEAFEEYSSNIAPHLRYDAREDFSAGWDAATQQLEAEREKHDKRQLTTFDDDEINRIIESDLPLSEEFQKLNKAEKILSIASTKAGAKWMREELKLSHDQEMLEFAVEEILKPKYMNDVYTWKQVRDAILKATER